ncbi:MAG TPA: hypothetical protein GX717_01685 [Clostridiaceae bacterium]|nr:hypothetical protein [Clostridiaceae bacterium]
MKKKYVALGLCLVLVYCTLCLANVVVATEQILPVWTETAANDIATSTITETKYESHETCNETNPLELSNSLSTILPEGAQATTQSQTTTPDKTETTIPDETETTIPDETETTAPDETETTTPEETETTTPEETELDQPDGIPIDTENFPDTNFRKYIVNNFDNDKNGYLSTDEVESVTRIKVSVKYHNIDDEIESLKGVEYFPNLKILDCNYNWIATLDVSNNPLLTELFCNSNELTSLNLQQNPALKILECSYNQLTNLDTSQNPLLTELACYGNELTSLDVSVNPELEQIECYHNQLTELNLGTASNITKLSCLNNNLTSLNLDRLTALVHLDCDANQLTQLDISSNTALTWLSCVNNQLEHLNINTNTALEELYCSKNNLSSISLRNNPQLKYLSCNRNDLSSLNVKDNRFLNWLDCSNNNLAELDLSHNTALSWLDCSGNNLTQLNLTANTNLSGLECNNNQLTALDLTPVALGWMQCKNNSYEVASDRYGNYDLTSLPEPFDVDKTSNWNGGTVVDHTLNFDPEVEWVTYDYAVSENETATFQLNNVTPVINHFTVTFESSGGSSVPAQTVIRGSTASLPVNPFKPGYVFESWQHDGEPYDFTTPVHSDLVLYATWEVEPPLPIVENAKARALTHNTVDLIWAEADHVGNTSIDGYLVYRKTTEEPLTLCAVVSEPCCLDRNARSDEANFYFIFTYRKRSDGSLQISQPSSYVYCIPTPRDTIKTVQNVQARAVGLNSVHLSWDPVDNVDGYMIFRKLANGGLEYVYLTPNTRFTDLQAYRDQYNFYFIFGYRTSWGGKHIIASPSHYVYARPGLADVTHLTAAQKNYRVVLTWQNVPFADGYAIYRKEEGQTTLEYMYIVEANHTRWTDVNPIRGKVNYYFVTPYFKEGDTMHIKPVNPYTYSIVPK